MATEVSRVAKYSDGLVQFEPLPHDEGELLARINAPQKKTATGTAQLKLALNDPNGRYIVLLNANLNHTYDVEDLLRRVHTCLGRRGRVVVLAYSPYWAWVHTLTHALGLRKAEAPHTFLTRVNVQDLARLSGFEVVRERPLVAFPFRLLGLGAVLNALLEALPLIREFAFVMMLVLRPLHKATGQPSLSIVIPARDEKGNIEPAIRRLPVMHANVEVVFVEGNSRDGTWEEIQRVCRMSWENLTVTAYKQPGKGKADAVWTGIGQCRGDVITILDADLTIPPELLQRFYEAYANGVADFINGTRLVYPMEGQAMRFLNWLGNIFFAKALSFTLDCRLGDSLCGTKLFSRADHEWMRRWNKDFGRFDPFGDYELLFSAAELGLGIVDVPVRYRARTYGSSKISRFRDGFTLLRMTATGLWRVRLGVRRR